MTLPPDGPQHTEALDSVTPSDQDRPLAPGAASAGADLTLASPAARPVPPAGPIPRPELVPGYEILGELGRGGMGVVYKARQKKLHRTVALKMVLAGAHASPITLARFHAEAAAIAQFQHPNIVQIYEIGEQDGLPFFSLEFIDGDSLEKKTGGKPLPPREAALTVAILASAMAAAHARGIIHRDLKPANVLFTADGHPKITDFGLAKRIEDDSRQTKSGTLLGTPSYMSPEQARGETHEVGPLSDLYALGAILYELLTGRPPFVGSTLLETVLMVRSQEPVPPRKLNPRVPRDLETICLKCLQKEPSRRYDSCAALADDLRRFLGGMPIHARPVGPGERAWRWCRRNPRIAGLTVAVAALLAALAGGLALLAVRHSRDREAVAETRRIALQRHDEAAAAAAAGDHRRARDLLKWSDPLLTTRSELATERGDLGTLQAQVDSFAEFKNLLDEARFACRFGSRSQKEKGQTTCHRLIALYDDLENRTGRAAAGLPSLSPDQEQLFKEDVFEAFLVAALVEMELDGGQAAARQALAWLDRAEQVLPGTRTVHVYRAAALKALGQETEAQAEEDQALKTAPSLAVDHFWHGFAHNVRGLRAARQGDPKAAREFHRKENASYAAFLQQRPDHFWGYFNWANSHALLGEPQDLHDALVGYTACLRLRDDFPWTYNNRGTVHLRLGNHEQARADFSAALARSDQYAEAYTNRALALIALGQDEDALADLNRAIQLDPEAPAPCKARAGVWLRQKRVDEAARDFDEAVRLDPHDLAFRVARAEFRLGRKDYPGANEDLSAVLAARPRAAAILRARAILHWLHLRDFDAALRDFEQLAQLDPANAEARRCSGAIQIGRREYTQAAGDLRRALELRPGYPDALWDLAQIDLWQGRPAEGIQKLDPVAAKLPDAPPEVLNVRGDLYQALGRRDEAAADYRRMIELRPQDHHAYVSLAGLFLRQGREEEARATHERLVQAAPKSAAAWLARAEFRRARGEHDGALADCDKAAACDPSSPLPDLARAAVDASRGRAAEAVAAAEKARAQAAPHDGQALYAAARVQGLAAAGTGDPALRSQYADRAVALLVQVFDKGFHDLNYPEHNRMADDPALAPIRPDPRVRDLLAHRPAGK